jgi:hypothetical protein
MDLPYFSMSQLATITGLDRRTVKDRLVNVEPHKVLGKAIIYDARQALPVLLGFNDPNETKTTQTELKRQELRFERVRAEKLELELEVLKGLHVPVSEVCKSIEKEYTYVRSTLLSVPSKRAMVLALESDPATIRQILEEDINEALNHLQADIHFEQPEVVEESEPVKSEV